MNSIAVLMTCHNRKNETIKCLKALYNCTVPDSFSFEVFLVDDGSNDGTAIAISEAFPVVNIIKGDGNLFWNRGMHLAWLTASNSKKYDYYLWLNDDTFLFANALCTMLEKTFDNTIVCGTTQSAVSKKLTYGGWLKYGVCNIIPNGQFQKCHHFNGNFVLIPSLVFDRIGNLDTVFHHAVGDFDYGLRASKHGVNLLMAPHIIGICEPHPNIPIWRNSQLSLSKRFKHLYSPASGCYPPQFFVFDRRHNGLASACFHYLSIHFTLLFPFARR